MGWCQCAILAGSPFSYSSYRRSRCHPHSLLTLLHCSVPLFSLAADLTGSRSHTHICWCFQTSVIRRRLCDSSVKALWAELFSDIGFAFYRCYNLAKRVCRASSRTFMQWMQRQDFIEVNIDGASLQTHQPASLNSLPSNRWSQRTGWYPLTLKEWKT